MPCVPDEADEVTMSSPAGQDCLDRVHDLMAQLWQRRPEISDLDRMLFTTAVMEIAGNIVEHGDSSTVSVTLRADADRLMAQLVDNGSPGEVDLNADLPDDVVESGRGLPLARLAVDEISYEHRNGHNGWRLVRRRSGR